MCVRGVNVKNANRMIIKLIYDGERFGQIIIHSPTGGRNKLMWRIGSAVLLFGGWLMFGKHKNWVTETSN